MANLDNNDQSRVILLDQFSDANLSQWNRISALHDEYHVKLFYHLESLRNIHHKVLRDTLRAQKSSSIVVEKWWRIVDHKYSNNPLSSLGSLRNGGRFNIGNDLNNFKPFPVLYIAENETTAYNEKFGQTVAANNLTSNELALRSTSSYTAVRLKLNLNNIFDLSHANNLSEFVKIISTFYLTAELKELAKQIGIKPPYLVNEATKLKRVLLDNSWRYYPVQHDIPANSQLFGRLLKDAGFEGVLYPSTKSQGGKNIAIFCENLEKSNSFISLQDTPPDTVKYAKLDSSTWKGLSE